MLSKDDLNGTGRIEGAAFRIQGGNWTNAVIRVVVGFWLGKKNRFKDPLYVLSTIFQY